MMPDNVAQLFGRPTARVDGIAKVTGAARYASDEPVAHPVYAYLVTSSIARGRISRFQLEEAKAVRGVIDIFNRRGGNIRVRPRCRT
jgi:xanthine dehydrogenase YagR molybdenum-binding subunit